MILVIVDSHSKWIEAHVVTGATSQATIEKLRSVFSTHGLPEVIVSDNSTSPLSAKSLQCSFAVMVSDI